MIRKKLPVEFRDKPQKNRETPRHTRRTPPDQHPIPQILRPHCPQTGRAVSLRTRDTTRSCPHSRQFVMVKNTERRHSGAVIINEDVRKYSAEQGIAEEEALKQGLEAKSKEFVEKGAEVYAKA